MKVGGGIFVLFSFSSPEKEGKFASVFDKVDGSKRNIGGVDVYFLLLLLLISSLLFLFLKEISTK